MGGEAAVSSPAVASSFRRVGAVLLPVNQLLVWIRLRQACPGHALNAGPEATTMPLAIFVGERIPHDPGAREIVPHGEAHALRADTAGQFPAMKVWKQWWVSREALNQGGRNGADPRAVKKQSSRSSR